MEALLLAIYSFFVWLIFFKFKWLPWNKVSQVTVVIIPIVALTALILFLNVYAPSSSDVRVIKYVVQVVPQVRGRVIEVPVEGNNVVKKGDVLFIPAGVKHGAKNVGSGKGSELATYIVEKGKPLVVLAK
jgi:multidrug efflux pump subunit AcrA (membrane-fusion protein)